MVKRIDRAIDVAKATMTGDLRDVMLDILKNGNLLGGKTWRELKEGEQRHVVQMLEDKVKNSVTRSIDIIASEGRRHIKGLLKSVTVKDGLKCAFEASKMVELRHDLMDAQGDTVLLVLTGSDKFQGERARVKYDKDQPELAIDNTPKQEATNGESNETPHNKETGEITEEGTGDQEPEDDIDDEGDAGEEDFDDEDDDENI